MQQKIVITIARQYGSGGRIIGRKIAEALGIPFLDKEIITEVVHKSGIHTDLIRSHEEKAGTHLGQAFASGGMNSYFSSTEPNLNDRIFLTESETITQYAEAGSCVIIGRCGSYVLRDKVPHLSVFINANMDDRIHRVVHDYGVTEKRVRELILKKDKQRAHYHHYYTDEKWMDLEHYDLTLNSSVLGLENSVKLILDAARYRFQ